jgi:hypothetical protein
VKCIRCDFDARYPQRPGRICPQCKGAFAFEPRDSDPITDLLFKNAIAAVSAQGQVRFGVEHLYYEVCRRKRRTLRSLGYCVVVIACGLGYFVAWRANPDLLWLLVVTFFAGLLGVIGLVVDLVGWWRARYVTITPEAFRGLYDRWCDVHGTPDGVIQRREPPASPPPAEPDLGDYSFDRAVVCDRARTVDLLLANNFHFENNCAILSVDGYPSGPFATVRTMLQRNPNLHVFVLHDATPEGCRLAQRLRHDRDWFPAGVRITDVGLRPGHARQFSGLWQRAERRAMAAGQGITAREARWLSRSRLELAAVRPAQVMKRLFRALNRQSRLETNEAYSDSGVFLFIDRDEGSFTTDADALDAGADAFG